MAVKPMAMDFQVSLMSICHRSRPIGQASSVQSLACAVCTSQLRRQSPPRAMACYVGTPIHQMCSWYTQGCPGGLLHAQKVPGALAFRPRPPANTTCCCSRLRRTRPRRTALQGTSAVAAVPRWARPGGHLQRAGTSSPRPGAACGPAITRHAAMRRPRKTARRRSHWSPAKSANCSRPVSLAACCPLSTQSLAMPISARLAQVACF